jgi:hypothetical protein
VVDAEAVAGPSHIDLCDPHIRDGSCGGGRVTIATSHSLKLRMVKMMRQLIARKLVNIASVTWLSVHDNFALDGTISLQGMDHSL